MSRLSLIAACLVLLLGGCDRAGDAPAQPVAGGADAKLTTGVIDRKFAGTAIPALTVSPPMLYERGGVSDLRSMMTGHPTRALHFKQNFGHTLRQLEPLLARLADLRPVLFMQSGDFRPEELLDVAASRPETHFVIRGIMWGGMAQGFDYLRRRANVILDSSWLHTWNALELIVREFGADRVVFGLGGPAHNGAARLGQATRGGSFFSTRVFSSTTYLGSPLSMG